MHFDCVFLAPNISKQFCMRIVLSSLGNFNCPERNGNNTYAKLPACAGRQETRKQSGNLEMANCPGTNTHSHPYPNPSHHYGSRKTRFEPVAVDLTAKDAREMFFFFNIYSREYINLCEFQRLISSCGAFWLVLIISYHSGST